MPSKRTRRSGKTTKASARAKRPAKRPAARRAPARKTARPSVKAAGNGASRSKVTPFLWFDDNLEEAIAFYKTVFPDVKVRQLTRYTEAGPGPKGSVMSGSFTIAGQEFGAVNGGPIFKFNESVSFVIDCKDQREVDHYWTKLTANGGQESQCGWLKDRFGLSWQVVPRQLLALLSDKDTKKAGRAMQAMLQMRKIDIRTIEDAAAAR